VEKLSLKVSIKTKNGNEIVNEDKAFTRKKAKIKSSNLIDSESMFYNPYKKNVTFKSANGSKVVSRNYVI